MSSEPLVAVKSVCIPGMPDQDATTFYRCDVTVKDEIVGLDFIFVSGERPAGKAPAVARDGRTLIEFVILNEEYCFPELCPFRRNRDSGPFAWNFDQDAPESQRKADFRFPPVLDVEIAADRRSAQMVITNRYSHLAAHLYNLAVSVEHCRTRETLVCDDPTLIEDPFEGHGPVDPPSRA